MEAILILGGRSFGSPHAALTYPARASVPVMAESTGLFAVALLSLHAHRDVMPLDGKKSASCSFPTVPKMGPPVMPCMRVEV